MDNIRYMYNLENGGGQVVDQFNYQYPSYFSYLYKSCPCHLVNEGGGGNYCIIGKVS